MQDITVNRHLEREVVLVKVRIGSSAETKAELVRVVEAFNASLIDVSSVVFIVELSGSSEKIDELINNLSQHEIIEVARSGVTGLTSTENILTID